jgi:hypothetical protein
MVKQNKEEIVLEFVDLIYDEVRSKYSEDAGIKNVLYHLVEKGLIDSKKLRDYMVIKDFNKIMDETKQSSTYTFMDLSIKYDISDRTAQSIVYRERHKFLKKNNIR